LYYSDVSSNINISDDSTYVFQTPKLKKVETNDSDIEMSLEQNIEESSTNNTNYGIYFEKSQIQTSESSDSPVLPVINCKLFLT
jgi:hypothetical protein